jgi:hypothetical protein
MVGQAFSPERALEDGAIVAVDAQSEQGLDGGGVPVAVGEWREILEHGVDHFAKHASGPACRLGGPAGIGVAQNLGGVDQLEGRESRGQGA